jgi:formylglycine-generating enzyme required for sulfatase activity
MNSACSKYFSATLIAAMTSVAASEILSAALTFRDCEVCPEMVVIPAGTIQIGAPVAEGGDDEWPIHDVVFLRPLAVGKYEVTRFEFAMFVEATAYGVDFSCRYLAEVGWQHTAIGSFTCTESTTRDFAS